MKRKVLIYTICAVLTASYTGCDSFLDVKPKSSMAEDDIFTSEVGYQQALTGVYASMATRELYGDQLSMGFVSAMAQNYVATAHGFVFAASTALNFETDEVKGISEAVWSNSYNAIAGINNILAHIDTKGSVFTEDNYALIKGEALGLRAYLHFELLRLYAPTVSSGVDLQSIPYLTTIGAGAKKPESVGGFVDKILKDLDEAKQLLDKVDPIFKKDHNRRFYMNAIAVTGLRARVNLYAGNNEQAYQDAQTVIKSEILQFVTNAEISAAAGVKDRLFSKEQLFSVRTLKMKDWVETGSNAYFKYTTSLSSNNLTRTRANFQTLYETATGGSTDYRYVYLIENDAVVAFCSKYWQTWSGTNRVDRLDQTVPLLRLSEMYYIAAETAPVVSEGVQLLNIVRKNRGLGDLNATGADKAFLTNEITKEYQKEFYAEGQLFYYYKRLNFGRMQFASKTLSSKSYIIPIPESETEFNQQYNTLK